MQSGYSVGGNRVGTWGRGTGWVLRRGVQGIILGNKRQKYIKALPLIFK